MTPAGAIVVGHSIGGLLALRLAGERGVEASAVVLSSYFFPPARNGRGTLTSVRDYAGHRVAYLRQLRSRADTASGSRAGGAAALGSLARLGLRRGEFAAGHHVHRGRPEPWLAAVLPWLESHA